MADKLIRCRSIVRTAVTKTITAAKSEIASANPDAGNLRRCLANLQGKLEELRTWNKDIVEVTSMDDIDEEIGTADDYSSRIYEACSDISAKLDDINRPNVSNDLNTSRTSSINSDEQSNATVRTSGLVKLPKFEISKFNGKITEWTSFCTCFEVGIHENPELNAKTKLLYLNGVLEGEAAEIVRGLAINDKNYDFAIEQLKKQYGRPELIRGTHLKALSRVKPVHRTADVTSLRKMYNECKFHVQSLETLGMDSTLYGDVVGPYLINAIPEPLKVEFSRKFKDEWTLRDFMSFFNEEVETRERVARHNDNASTEQMIRSERQNNGESRKPTQFGSAAALTTTFDRCRFCNDTGHQGRDCPLDVEKRRDACMRRGLCFRCLKPKHLARDCSSDYKCRNCGWSHHVWICDQPKVEEDSEEIINNNAVMKSSSAPVLLQTVYADIVGTNGKRRIRCFLDGGSEGTFISSNLTSKLSFDTKKRGNLSLRSFGHQPKSHEVKVVKFTLQHPKYTNIQLNLDAIEVPFITCIPHREISHGLTKLLQNKRIEITTYNDCEDDEEIHLLIGNDHYWQVATGAIESITKELKAFDTHFGWTLMGRDCTQENGRQNLTTIGINHVAIGEDTNDLLRKFWELDAIGILPENMTEKEDERKVIHTFKETTRWNNGFYEVQMPWKRQPTELDSNELVALRRFWTLTRKMKKDDQLYQRYNAVIMEQLKEGILEEVKNENSNNPIYYLPHRPVIKEDRVTTKLRIVYDASSHDKGCLSLNECLHKGPNELPQIVELVNEFRKGEIAVIADIKQAFHRVVVRNEDRDVLRFFWLQEGWKTGDSIIPRILRSTRVMFGTTASPFLLSATIKFHLEKLNSSYPETCERLRKSMYVDDLIVSVNNYEEAAKIYKESKKILLLANMQLVKWKTNSVQLKEDLQLYENDMEDPISPAKILGLRWDTQRDKIELDTQEIINRTQQRIWTKRNLIKTTATLFDPLGFVEPFTITAKILFQQTWKLKIGWDVELTDEIKLPWQHWCEQIKELNKLSLPRQILPGLRNDQEVDLHLFCDASPQAYGVVAYLSNQKSSSICISKSRVAPIKLLTIPRLELMATVLAARLIKTLTTQYRIRRITCWTDSQISLCWLRDNTDKIKPFISNRVQEVMKTTEKDWWRHCPGQENPADLLTRGIEADKLLNSKLWWTGPPWLINEKNWPKELIATKNEELDEISIMSCQLIKLTPIFDIDGFSNWTRVLRVTAFVLRFISNLKNKFRETRSLTLIEINKAEEYWIKTIQHSIYYNEIENLRKGKKIDTTSNLTGVKLFIDDSEILRIENRLEFSELTVETKYPAIIPPHHHLTKLIIQHCHLRIRHGGLADTLSEVRTKFWIPRGRVHIKKQLKNCFLCRRLHQRPLTECTGPLPRDRVKKSPPFAVTGVDFAGPLYLKNGDKSYVALFTCAVTRAIHLELISNQSTETFILALKRFMGRRAIPSTIYSDNAKTFKRADKDLNFLFEHFHQSRIQDFLTNEKITWKYIVETAPWWGGFWERLVRSTKTTLKKILGRASLDFEELLTALVEAEAIINSRPLTYVYNEPNEPRALSPAHFLVGHRIASLPDTRLPMNHCSSTNIELRKRWRYRQRLLDSIWNRWSHEYLTELRTFSTKTSKEKLIENSIVLVEDLNRARWLWKIGRVNKIFFWTRSTGEILRSTTTRPYADQKTYPTTMPTRGATRRRTNGGGGV